MTSTDETTNTLAVRMIGQVKWFNNKAGYGFITVSDGEYSGKDIFAHYSTIRVTNSQYKYLVQGEYVEFNLVKSSTETHEFQATEVTGIKNGPLMCETRRHTISEETVERARPSYQRRYRVSDNDERDRSDNRVDNRVDARGPPRREYNDYSRRSQSNDDDDYTPVTRRTRTSGQRNRSTEKTILSSKIVEESAAV